MVGMILATYSNKKSIVIQMYCVTAGSIVDNGLLKSSQHEWAAWGKVHYRSQKSRRDLQLIHNVDEFHEINSMNSPHEANTTLHQPSFSVPLNIWA